MQLDEIKKELFCTEERFNEFIVTLQKYSTVENANLLGSLEVNKLVFKRKSGKWIVSYYNETGIYNTDLIDLKNINTAQFKFHSKRKLIW